MAPLDILFISFSILLHFRPFYIKFYLNRVFQMITLVDSKFTFISFWLNILIGGTLSLKGNEKGDNVPPISALFSVEN